MPLCSEGRLVGRELEDLPPKDAYCLAALPAIYQVQGRRHGAVACGDWHMRLRWRANLPGMCT